MYQCYRESLQGPLQLGEIEVTLENIQARIRGNILMAISNKFGHMVLSTGNKSELAVGYCTLYGDMSGGLSVLADVPKTMVYELARHLNRERELIPPEIIRRAPSAELRPDQKDQDTLPPYEILDRIMNLYLEDRCSYQDIVELGLRPRHGALGDPDHRPQRIQAAAGGPGPEGDFQGVWHGAADSHCRQV